MQLKAVMFHISSKEEKMKKVGTFSFDEGQIRTSSQNYCQHKRKICIRKDLYLNSFSFMNVQHDIIYVLNVSRIYGIHVISFVSFQINNYICDHINTCLQTCIHKTMMMMIYRTESFNSFTFHSKTDRKQEKE